MQKVVDLNALYLRHGHRCVFDLYNEGYDNSFIDEAMEFRYYPLPLNDSDPDSQVEKSEKRKNILSKKNIQAAYKKRAWKLTDQNDLSVLKDFEKRGFKDYHLDHKISIYYGFMNIIPAEHIAHISNLRMIPCEQNMEKGADCFLDEENRWILDNV